MHRKAIKGFILAPLIPCAIFSLIATSIGLFGGIPEGNNPFTYIFGGLIWFVYALPVAYIVTSVLGVPTYILFNKENINNLKAYLLAGTCMGFVSPLLLLFILSLKAILEMGWLLFAFSTVFGMLTSYSFWAIVVKSPNNTFKRDAKQHAPLN